MAFAAWDGQDWMDSGCPFAAHPAECVWRRKASKICMHSVGEGTEMDGTLYTRVFFAGIFAAMRNCTSKPGKIEKFLGGLGNGNWKGLTGLGQGIVVL